MAVALTVNRVDRGCDRTPAAMGFAALDRSTTDTNVGGLAEAFHETARASGYVGTVCFFLAPANAATSVGAAIYADDGAGHPGMKLGEGWLAGAPTNGSFNQIPLSAPVLLNAGTVYWIAFLAPAGGGTLAFLDHCCNYQQGPDDPQSGPSENSAESSLAGFPGLWSTGLIWNRYGGDGYPLAFAG